QRQAFVVGLIGLVEFAPLQLLALPAGQLADRLPRRLVLAVALIVETAIAVLLVLVSRQGADRLWPFLALAGGTGVAGAIGWPAARALLPARVPPELVERALAFRS